MLRRNRPAVVERSRGLKLQLMADKSGLVNADGSWPFAGLKVVGTLPRFTRLSTSLVQRGVTQGFIKRINEIPFVAPGGPDNDPWRKIHTFITCDFIDLLPADGDPIRYKVTRQPGKYSDPTQPKNIRVDWYYDLELVEVGE